MLNCKQIIAVGGAAGLGGGIITGLTILAIRMPKEDIKDVFKFSIGEAKTLIQNSKSGFLNMVNKKVEKKVK